MVERRSDEVFPLEHDRADEGHVGVDYDVDVASLRTAVAGFFAAIGMPAEHASWTAAALVDADRSGVSTHGTVRMESYADAIGKGYVAVHPDLRVESEFGGLARLDAGNAQGQVAGHWAVDEGMRLAAAHGVALVSVRGANHLGALGFYLERAAEAGFGGWLSQATSPNTLAVGAREPRLGNNPFAMAIPTRGDYPLVLDLSCSQVARGKIRLALRDGLPIPEGWALRPDGQPATTAEEAMTGALLPFGGHKGAGISTMLGAFAGVLTGAAFGPRVPESYVDAGGRDIGFLLVLFDVSRLLDADELEARMGEYVDYILTSPRAPGAALVTVPGKGAAERRACNATTVPMKQERWSALTRLLAERDVEPPLATPSPYDHPEKGTSS